MTNTTHSTSTMTLAQRDEIGHWEKDTERRPKNGQSSAGTVIEKAITQLFDTELLRGTGIDTSGVKRTDKDPGLCKTKRYHARLEASAQKGFIRDIASFMT